MPGKQVGQEANAICFGYAALLEDKCNAHPTVFQYPNFRFMWEVRPLERSLLQCQQACGVENPRRFIDLLDVIFFKALVTCHELSAS